jgi:hypothetical protein
MGEVRNINPARRFMLHVQGRAGPRFHRPKVPRRHGFTAFPDTWEYRLRGAKHKATYALALYILRRDWETNGEPVKVTNVAMKERGVDRWRKQEGLDELEALGLVRVRRRLRKYPTVTLLIRQ